MRSLLDCSEYWQSRSTEYPFYTLGKSAYLDGKTDAYYEDSAVLNDILLGHFSGLYESGNTCITRRVRRTYRVST
jgi:hypothetical protein